VFELHWLFNLNVMLFLAKGLGVTIVLAVVSGVISFFAGAMLAFARMAHFPLIHYPAVAYIELLRSLPLLLIIFAVYFASDPLLNVNLQPFPAAVVALSAFTSAVIAEIVRAGLQSVDTGIIQASQAQGFSGWQIFRVIRLPLALRRMTPALVTQFISLVKSTSLVVVIGVPEFLNRAVIVTSNPPFGTVPVYILVAVVYFLINYSLSFLSRQLEKRETGGMTRVSQ